MSKNLVIVESPAKAKTIEGYLGKDFTVKSSYGHVRDLPKENDAIDIKNGFKPTYIISPEKIKVVNELKALAKSSDEVWLATDDDREGESISWHLKEALGLADNTKRIVFREITKKAIQNAIQNPRTIDVDLVNAQQARRVLDRLIGFELSPVLWSKVKKGLSAGRVQSVAVRIVVEREREIENFDSKSSFKIVALFNLKGGKVLQAELPKNFETEAQAKTFLEKCIGAEFKIKNLETKPAKKSPAPPFTTSTLQQEASRKLGYSVASTMSYAQKLYEAGKISYMRTDSTSLSEDAVQNATAAITAAYGAEFVQNRVYKTKDENAQEAHEAIRPTDFSANTAGSDLKEKRLYELIWKRAIASQMADAQLERTTATVSISTTSEDLVAQGEVIKFEGFLKVYLEGKDDEDDEENSKMLPPLNIGQILDLDLMKGTERFSRPPARYTEASLVKALEEKGVGRPSTYAPTISTIIKREYVVKEDRDGKERSFKEMVLKNNTITEKVNKETYGTEKSKLFPTSVGMVVNDFLVDNFKNVVDFKFTADVEDEFDEIAKGKIEWSEMIGNFYQGFHQTIEDSKGVDRNTVGSSRDLGIDPKTGKPISVRLGKFGPYVQLGEQKTKDEEKPQFFNLKKDQLVTTITLEEALALMELPKLPREVGFFEDKPMIIGAGKMGPYIKHDDKYTSLPPTEDPFTVTEARAIEIVIEKRQADVGSAIGIFEGEPITSGKGRFGPYVKHGGKFYSLGRGESLESISFDRAVEIINVKRNAEANKFLKEFPENDTIKVLNGMYGPYIQIGKRNVKIPKDMVPADLTLEDCIRLGEEAPAPAARGRKK
ncbi:type I DNA topoisomerase [Arcicella sp. LKC2W]|uniref:type I DNA topoisomerase n=1 Tax=Arcicella sp. LKC2W TaxID=2984198 RepID=UPI002B2000E4|nr:type I DNA topoisomerase [Arcicella sp. LKC2W]MEA5458473.1 type I DNA topoisomerase [Arcicella sp. LKC2W]